MAFDSNNLHDPSKYDRASGGQLKNYNYSVIVNKAKGRYGIVPSYITVSSNETLTEEQIFDTATQLVENQPGRYAGEEIVDMQIDGATRSQALGEF